MEKVQKEKVRFSQDEFSKKSEKTEQFTSKRKRSASDPENSEANKYHKKIKDDYFYSDRIFKKNANYFFKKSLPVVYAVQKPNNSLKSPTSILGRDLLKDLKKWISLTEKDLDLSFNGYDLSSINFFVAKNKSEEPQHIGSASSFVKNKKNSSLLAYNLLSFDEDKDIFSARNTVTMAAMFFAGEIVREDKDYAQNLIKTVKDKKLLQSTFSSLLVYSCIDKKDIKITKALIALGADPNRADESNKLAIICALEKENEEAAKFLLEAGTSVTGKIDSSGTSLWDYLNEKDDPYDKKSNIYILAQEKRLEEIRKKSDI